MSEPQAERVREPQAERVRKPQAERVDDREAIRVRVRRLPHAEGLPLPTRASAGAAGLDLRAALAEPRRIEPGAIERVPTGLVLEVPIGFEMQIRPRSGLAMSHGITLPNTPATIDSDYRGEIVVALINLGREPFVIEPGMRIAQMILSRVPSIEWVEAEELSPTPRGSGGFGHTGVD
ncbi:MAG: dUTP diphosphatase [Candidatus Eisenbacteria bacterium]